jgi:aspartyl-tRNA(Asn)/glutamyl-tRNA(Gln) amidotransferase subunit B
MSWEVVIGLETHAQLSTASKIFSPASTAFGAAPNTQAHAIDLALPGVLPVLNEGAVERAIRFGLAVGATIAERSVFARKNYFYPDLPKGYQISQYEIPVVQGGALSCVVTPKSGEPYTKTIRLTRAHLEEDAGKSLHENLSDASGIDLNRAGTPLLEIVSEPEMRSSAEAVAYAKALHALVVWLGICDGNMQEGSFRCDANVSVRRAGETRFGTRVEIKNLNSFKFMQAAIDYEVRRQIELIEDGGTVVQETRLFDPDRGETRSMRSKEDAMDYRYFPDPDLLPLAISREWVAEVREDLGELPQDVRARYVSAYGISPLVAEQLTTTRELSDFFESACIRNSDTGFPIPMLGNPALVRRVASWVVGEISRLMNADGGQPWEFWVSPQTLGRIALREHEGVLTTKTAKELLGEFWAADRDRGGRRHEDAVDEAIESRGLKQISDAGAIEKIIDEVLTANAQSVAEFKAGKEKAFNALVGQAMRATKGKANPQQVNDILRRKLAT